MSKVKPAPLPANTVIGGYRIVRRISAGGFGVVYLALAPDGQQVALAQRDETLISAVLDPQKLTDAKAGNSYLADRRPELYGALSAR